MAGLMTYLADGTRTLPMRRGSWVLRELLNDPPNNPPPNAGEIQPNTAGKNLTALAQRLELHRRDAGARLVPRQARSVRMVLETTTPSASGVNASTARVTAARRPSANSTSGTFPDGKRFSTLEEYKAGLMERKDKFARAFSVKLLTYALCRPVGYTDHELVDSLTEELKKNDYKIQSLIYAIVASEPFNTK